MEDNYKETYSSKIYWDGTLWPFAQTSAEDVRPEVWSVRNQQLREVSEYGVLLNDLFEEQKPSHVQDDEEESKETKERKARGDTTERLAAVLRLLLFYPTLCLLVKIGGISDDASVWQGLCALHHFFQNNNGQVFAIYSIPEGPVWKTLCVFKVPPDLFKPPAKFLLVTADFMMLYVSCLNRRNFRRYLVNGPIRSLPGGQSIVKLYTRLWFDPLDMDAVVDQAVCLWFNQSKFLFGKQAVVMFKKIVYHASSIYKRWGVHFKWFFVHVDREHWCSYREECFGNAAFFRRRDDDDDDEICKCCVDDEWVLNRTIEEDGSNAHSEDEDGLMDSMDISIVESIDSEGNLTFIIRDV